MIESTKKKLLQKLQDTLPEFAKPRDIAALKIFGSKNSLVADRKAGRGLPYISAAKNRTVYPKEEVLRYVSAHFYELKG